MIADKNGLVGLPSEVLIWLRISATAVYSRRQKPFNNFWIRLPVRAFPGVSYGLVAGMNEKVYIVMRDWMYKCRLSGWNPLWPWNNIYN